MSLGRDVKKLIVAFLLCWGSAPLADEHISRIAFGSCAMQTKAQPIWDAIAARKPDLFLFIGDAIYADYDGRQAYTPTEQTLKRDWDMLVNEPHYKAFSSRVPVMATWDNHDYGSHDGGQAFELKELTKQYFLDFFGEPQDSERRRTPGIYDARIFGLAGKRIQVILLDTRWFKGEVLKNGERTKGQAGSLNKYLPNPDPEVSLLGEVQWRWLEQQLKQPAELRLIASSTQVVSDRKGMDEWGNFPLERQRLLDLIRQVEDSAVIVLSGNVHFAELSQHAADDWRLLDFTSSGLTHTNKDYAAAENPYRTGRAYDGLNFGMIEVDWEKRPAPSVRLVTMDIDGHAVFESKLPLNELNSNKGGISE